jgi:osmotically-inducible protein OsmY
MSVKLSKMFTVLTAVVLLAGVSLFASETDSRIESSAKDSYVFKTYLKDDSVSASSKDGVVTLKGTVNEESHKSLAQDTVENLPGVKKVDNQLVFKGKDLAKNSDGWVALKVKTALLFHSNVRATKTDINVRDGIVTLSGEAASQAQKELTAEYAADIEGVKNVKNDMTVAKDPNAEPTLSDKIDDASITAQVKMALLTHHSTSAIKTSVKTNNGVVTLKGKAKNDAEKALVGKLTKNIKGVKDVENKMTVEK